MKTQSSPEIFLDEPEVINWLDARGAELEPASGFLTHSRRRLVNRIAVKARRSWWQRTWAVPRFRLAANAASAFALILVLGAFISVLFPAAQGSLPGEPLYPVKLGLEKIQLGLSLNQEQRADLLVQLAKERSNELQALMIDGEYSNIEVVSLRLMRQIRTARLYLAQAEDLSREQQLALTRELNQTLSLQILVLQTLVHTTPVESQPMVRHIMLATN
ncbi:MAG: DUF5667 domain-containing protein [Anaerolineales bacterium]|jgi:hypothetical protein|nr:DUF5667 domain-containing protein [Anaerolineales bacterium]